MDQKDHDLIVELSTKMTQLCKTSSRSHEENMEAHDKIMDKIDNNLVVTSGWVKDVHERIDSQFSVSVARVDACYKTFLQSKTFYWILGFVIAGLVSLATYTVTATSQMNNKIDIVEIK